MADNGDDFFSELTPEQQEELAKHLQPMAEALAKQWSSVMAPMVDQLSQQLKSAAEPITRLVSAMSEAAVHRFSNQIAEALAEIPLPKIDFTRLLAAFPSNLLDRLQQIEALADMALSDGIPISWVPRGEILDALLAADTTTERLSILVLHRQKILNDCENVLEGRSDAWASAARDCVKAARASGDEAAQSHAANLVDSIVLSVFAHPRHRRNTRWPRARATELAGQAFDLEWAMTDLAELLTVRPIPSAFNPWHRGDPPPATFNRHATAHCVGDPAVFCEGFLLVSVMLATSFARQFGSAGTDGPE